MLPQTKCCQRPNVATLLQIAEIISSYGGRISSSGDYALFEAQIDHLLSAKGTCTASELHFYHTLHHACSVMPELEPRFLNANIVFSVNTARCTLTYLELNVNIWHPTLTYSELRLFTHRCIYIRMIMFLFIFFTCEVNSSQCIMKACSCNITHLEDKMCLDERVPNENSKSVI